MDNCGNSRADTCANSRLIGSFDVLLGSSSNSSSNDNNNDDDNSSSNSLTVVIGAPERDPIRWRFEAYYYYYYYYY